MTKGQSESAHVAAVARQDGGDAATSDDCTGH